MRSHAAKKREHPRSPFRCSVEVLEPRAVPSLLASPVGFQPEQIRAAYGINSIRSSVSKADGTGQTIAIVDAFNDPHIVNDLNAFDKQFTLTQSRSTIFKQYGPAKSFLTVFNQNGKKINPATSSSPGPQPLPPVHSPYTWEAEVSLDVEWAHAIAPARRST